MTNTKPLFPMPMAAPAYPQKADRRDVPDPADPTDWITKHGHCHDFCDQDGPADGQSVDDHGPYCQSRTVNWFAAVDIGGEPVDAWADLVGRYSHGAYHRSVHYGPQGDTTYVRLSLTKPDERGDEAEEVFITSAEARKFAASMIFAADALDRLDRFINGAKADREQRCLAV